MNDKKLNEEMRALLKQAIAPAKDTELQCDLWPQMLHKLEGQSIVEHGVPWFDWALAAVAAAALFVFPGVIPALLYHL
ncbi:MAG: hypothetical protein WA857_07960 [Candidatus Acidiferrum sp.]